MLDENCLNIYTDWSSYQWPRRGGTGIIFVTIDENNGADTIEKIRSWWSFKWGRIGEMELQACIYALKEALERDLSWYKKIIIYTDSMYVVKFYKVALFQRSQNKWLKSSGAPVLNAQLWKELIKVCRKIYETHRKQVEFQRVKWHTKWEAKNPYNTTVDKEAKLSANTPSTKRINIVNVRRKKFKEKKVLPGSVEMLWQRITIYIVEDEYLKIQKIYKYRYQVVSKSSKFYKCTDFIYSEIMLSAGHTYFVKFNEDWKNPCIVKKFHEVEKKEAN